MGSSVKILRSIVASSLFAAIVFASWETEASASSWRPERPVEIIVGAAAGSGLDLAARNVQRVLQNKRLVSVPVLVINRPGGGGALALSYLAQQQGDAHYIYLTAPPILTNQITGVSSVNYKQFTLLAKLYDEYVGFGVAKTSQMKTGVDLVGRLRADVAGISAAIATVRGNANHIALASVAKVAGVDARKLRVVIFDSGSKSIGAVLGGHIDLAITNASNLLPHMANGAITMLAIAAPQRVGGAFKDIPTWREQGVDSVLSNWRSIIGPNGLSAQQIAYWDGVLAQLTRSSEWQDVLQRQLWADGYLPSADTRKFWDAQHAEFKEMLTELGLAK